MKKAIRSLIDQGVQPGMSPEDAKYIQMCNLGALLLIAVNLPYMGLCLLNGWTIVSVELGGLIALLFLTPLINRSGRHTLAVFYFGTLLNVHIVFVTWAMGKESLLQLLIFLTAGGVFTYIRKVRPLPIIGSLSGIVFMFVLALVVENAFGPFYELTPFQTLALRVFSFSTIFIIVIVNAVISRFGSAQAEHRLRREQEKSSRLLKKLREQEQYRIEFFQNISHELRTPLTLISGPLEHILSQDPNMATEELKQELGMMVRNCRRLHVLINQISDLTKLDAGMIKPVFLKGNLSSFVLGIVSSFTPIAREQNIRINTAIPKEDLYILFDQDIMEKILSNLLSNAFKFTALM